MIFRWNTINVSMIPNPDYTLFSYAESWVYIKNVLKDKLSGFTLRPGRLAFSNPLIGSKILIKELKMFKDKEICYHAYYRLRRK